MSESNLLREKGKGESMRQEPEYREGPEARKNFDEGMTKLFQAKKPTAAKEQTKPKPKPKRKTASKG